MRVTLVLVLSALMPAALVACGDDTETPGPGAEPTPPPQAAPEPPERVKRLGADCVEKGEKTRRVIPPQGPHYTLYPGWCEREERVRCVIGGGGGCGKADPKCLIQYGKDRFAGAARAVRRAERGGAPFGPVR